MSVVLKRLFAATVVAGVLSAQSVLVVDRGLTDKPAAAQAIEKAGGGMWADSFQIGATGEIWMIETIRVWAAPKRGPACGKPLGDQLEKITLLGTLYNPPAPGATECDCHAAVAIESAPLQPGGVASQNPDVQLTLVNGLVRVDFRNVRWSVPGGMNIVFTVRGGGRAGDSCGAAAGWSLAAGSGGAKHRLHILDKAGVPAGLAKDGPERWFHLQVWAHRVPVRK